MAHKLSLKYIASVGKETKDLNLTSTGPSSIKKIFLNDCSSPSQSALACSSLAF